MTDEDVSRNDSEAADIEPLDGDGASGSDPDVPAADAPTTIPG